MCMPLAAAAGAGRDPTREATTSHGDALKETALTAFKLLKLVNQAFSSLKGVCLSTPYGIVKDGGVLVPGETSIHIHQEGFSNFGGSDIDPHFRDFLVAGKIAAFIRREMKNHEGDERGFREACATPFRIAGNEWAKEEEESLSLGNIRSIKVECWADLSPEQKIKVHYYAEVIRVVMVLARIVRKEGLPALPASEALYSIYEEGIWSNNAQITAYDAIAARSHVMSELYCPDGRILLRGMGYDIDGRINKAMKDVFKCVDIDEDTCYFGVNSIGVGLNPARFKEDKDRIRDGGIRVWWYTYRDIIYYLACTGDDRVGALATAGAIAAK